MTTPATTRTRRPSRLTLALAGSAVAVLGVALTGYLVDTPLTAAPAGPPLAQPDDRVPIATLTSAPDSPRPTSAASVGSGASDTPGSRPSTPGGAGNSSARPTGPDPTGPTTRPTSPTDRTPAPTTTPGAPTPTPTEGTSLLPISIPIDELVYPKYAAYNVPYTVRSTGVGQVMTGNLAADDSTVSMTPLWDWDSYPDQRWTLTDGDSDGAVRITMGIGSNCLYASSPVTTAPCGETGKFRWGIASYNNQSDGNSIVNWDLNKCLTAHQDAPVTMETCTGSGTQTWRLGWLE